MAEASMRNSFRRVSDIRLLQGLMVASILLPLALFAYASLATYGRLMETEESG